MSLPGKLCIGILEEDNPLRSYFRFKPLLIDAGGSYIPFDDDGAFPDEGCIRIVPDKNESNHFKARMHQNGLFCVVDLRAHPDENDKIRPNKNYRPGGDEINSCIVYSDVVLSPAPDMIYQVMPAENVTAVIPAPATDAVLLRQDGALLPGRQAWSAVETSGSMGMLNDTGERCAVETMQVFDLPGFRGETISFAIVPSALMAAVFIAPERPARRGEARPVAEARPVPEARPALEAKPAKAPEEKPVAPEAPQKTDADALDGEGREKVPEPKAENPADARPKRPARSEKASDAEPARDNRDKPWIHHDASMLPPPVDRRLSRWEQMMAVQAGLNPRRGRSLQELIDEKWTQSRLNQLGTPVSPIATGAPVRNPVDAATEAVREVWEQPQMRPQLLEALGQVMELDEALRLRRDAVAKASINRDLNALEAQRLELLGEMERLKAGGARVRERLRQEILKEEAAALADAVGKTQAARAEQRKCEQQAADARAAAADARALLDQLAGEQLEQKIRDVALTRRVAQRLEALEDAEQGLKRPPEAEAIGIEALIARLESRMAAEAWQRDRFTTANLCVCLALSPVLMLSGAPGSGKTTAARMLADALGARAAGRTVDCTASKRPLPEDERVKALARWPEAPAVLLLDDANLAPGPALAHGMAALHGPEWRLIATLQDAHSGAPMCAAALDKGFMVRMCVPEGLPWQPVGTLGFEAPTLASIAGVDLALPRAELPAEITARMEALRRVAAECGAPVSRRALNDSWRYCAAMLAILGEGADALKIFDFAVAQRVLPGLIAAAPDRAMRPICMAVEGLEQCRRVLEQPVPVML